MRSLQEQVAGTIAQTDPIRRNLKITLTYHRILHAMKSLTGAVDVSWPAYAVWASRTVGHYVRAEEIPKLARGFVEEADLVSRFLASIDADRAELGALLTLPATFLHAAIEQVTEEIPAQLGEGNRLVFEELGPAYMTFLEAFASHPRGDLGVLEAYLARYRPGRPEDGGQTMLARAFAAYHEAMRAEHPQQRAEWMLLANLTTGYHEQIRLQGPIAKALDARLSERVVAHLETTGHGISASLLRSLVRVAPHILDDVEHAWRNAATTFFMTLRLPDAEFRLGADVPPLPDGRAFPLDVTNLSLPDLHTLLAELDQTPNALRGSRAHDWSVLGDRMNFIVDVFRSRQQHAPLFDPPFDAAQMAEIDADRLPGGELF
ncbi:MAG: hypothetical protein QM778_12295 [Myxococcales bacterium]